jgi:AraC family transcriptional regulator
VESAASVWTLPGRRVESSRCWDGLQACVYARGTGEGLWRSDSHRLVIALTPVDRITVQIDQNPPQTISAGPGTMALYPAGNVIRTAGADSRYVQITWEPGIYHRLAPELAGAGEPALEPLVGFHDPLLAQIAHTLAHETGSSLADRLLVDSLGSALAVQVARRFMRWSPPPSATRGLSSERLSRVLDFIEANLDEDLPLAALAEVACLSPYHFSRCFKQAVGMGPQRYTQQRRIERAKSLMRRGGQPLAAIAAAVGFADQSHFTAIFRRETGTTPARFRALLA